MRSFLKIKPRENFRICSKEQMLYAYSFVSVNGLFGLQHNCTSENPDTLYQHFKSELTLKTL